MKLEILNSETIFSRDYLELNGQRYKITSQGEEPTEPGYGFKVETFKFEDDPTRDLALATIEPGAYTPPQLVLRKGLITDIPFFGNGRFHYYKADGSEFIHTAIGFDEVNSEEKDFSLTYGRGSYIWWRAGNKGLQLLEICKPPFKEGDLKNLNLETDNIPAPFAYDVRRGLMNPF